MPADALVARELARMLPPRRRLAREVRVARSVDSTSAALIALAEAGREVDGLLLAAEEQTAGRGRRAPDWWSGPPGANLAVSLADGDAPRPPEVLGLLAACALAEVLQRLCPGPAVALKWPNDLLVDGRKVAGLLADAPAAARGHVILGLGCNVHAAPPPGLCRAPAAAVADFAARPPRRAVLLALWLWALERRRRVHRRLGAVPLERELLAWLQRWAPHGVREEGNEVSGPLLEFSVRDGLTWGTRTARCRKPAGWISRLEPL